MSTADAPPPLPKNFLRASVLLLLREHPSHGYDMLERLAALGFERDDPGRLYRALRSLEEEGLVRSSWERSTAGPSRRIYELTRRGMEELHGVAAALAGTADVLDSFLTRYAEFAALTRRRDRSGRRS